MKGKREKDTEEEDERKNEMIKEIRRKPLAQQTQEKRKRNATTISVKQEKRRTKANKQKTQTKKTI